MAVDPVVLLAGPRGRRLCLEFVRRQHDDTQEAVQLGEAIFYAAYDLDPDRGTSRVLFGQVGDQYSPPNHSPEDVARLLAVVPLAEPDARAVLLTLAAAVENARYWQEPDGEDVLAGSPGLRASLARVANLVADSPHSDWWATPLDGTAQWVVEFEETAAGAGTTRTASETLNQWHAAQVSEEIAAQRDRPADPRAAWSGTWWSKPPTGLTRTTRALNGGGPAGLWLVEDSMGWDKATVHRVKVPHDARVYEIDSPEAWADLCRLYPLEVTASRRHDWYRATGRTGRWVVPDWARVGEVFDAVHLTVTGYLTTAGLAVTVEDNLMTVLAGWDPDQTYWLTEVIKDEPAQQTWRCDNGERWTLSTAR